MNCANAINCLASEQKQLREDVNNINVTVEAVDENGDILSSQVLNNNDTLRFISTPGFGVSVEEGSVEVKFAPNTSDVYTITSTDYSSSPITVNENEEIISLEAEGATPTPTVINLPQISTLPIGKKYIIKDSFGVCDLYPITITPTGGDTIDNSSTYSLNTVFSEITIYSDKVSNWIITGKTTDIGTLSPALQSIASLITSGNEMIYTTGANTYATSAITALGRNLVASSTQNNAQVVLGVSIGSDVQAYNAGLQSISGLNTISTGNELLYLAGTNSYAPTPFTAFARTLLDDADSATARTTLGLSIGTDVQAYDDALQSISGLTTSNNQMIYTTALDTYATTSLTSFARTLLDDTDSATARATLEIEIGTNVQAYDNALQSISDLLTSSNQMIYTTSTDTYATTSLTSFARTLLDDSNSATARATLELEIGTDVQAYDNALQSISGLITSSNQMIYTTALDTYATTSLTSFARTLLDDTDATTARATLGLGTIATLDSPSGDIVGTTDSQILTNKTLTNSSNSIRATQLGTSGSDVVITSTAPVAGQILVATNTTTATWQTVLGNVSGPASSVDNELVRFNSTTGKIIQGGTSVVLDDSNNLTGINLLSATSVAGTISTSAQPNVTSVGTLTSLNMAGNITMGVGDTVDGVDISSLSPLVSNATELGNLTTSEIQQLQNINGTTIIGTQWGYLGSLDQSLTTTDTPTFDGLASTSNVALNGGASVPTSQTLTITDAPTSGTDATNKAYVDSVASGAPPLEQVFVATIANLPGTYNSTAQTITEDLSTGSLTIDTFATSASDGNRYLVKNQTDNKENGIYTRIANSGSKWVLQRTSDFNITAGQINAGSSVYVDNGSANLNTTWSLQSAVTITDPETDPVAFLQTGGGNVTAGDGITQVGSVFNIVSADSTIQINTNDIQVSPTYSGNTSLDTLGNVATGTWNADTIDIAHGGTNATTASGARTNLGIAIGSDVQAYDAGLQSISGLTTSSNQMIYTTASDTYATTSLTSNARTLLADNSFSDMRTTLGLEIGTNVQAYDAGLQSISELITSSDEMLYLTGSDTYATTNFTAFARSLVDDVDATTARATLGVTIGSDVQAYDAGLQSISGLTTSANQMIYTTALNTYATTSLTSNARTLLADNSFGDMRATLGLAVGSDVQAYDAGLQSISGLTTSANQMIYTTALDSYATTSLTSFARTLLDDASASVARSTLGLGSIATLSAPSGTVVGTSDSQTLTNKNLIDNSTTFQDNLDNTKQFQFQASGITTSTTRTLTVPDDNITLVGTDNVQTLANKTITATSNTIRATQLGTTSTDVVISGATAPTSGQVLTATSGTVATWQDLPSSSQPTRVLYVDANGLGTHTTIAAALAVAGGDLANKYLIKVAPGFYAEANPLTIFSNVCLTSVGTSNMVTVFPATSTASNLFILNRTATVIGITAFGVTGASGFYYTGVHSSPPAAAGTVTLYRSQAINCLIGFNCESATPTVKESAVMVLRNCVTALFTDPCDIGFRAAAGSVISGSNNIASGFFAPSVAFETGYLATGDYALIDLRNSDCNYTKYGYYSVNSTTGNATRAKVRVLGGIVSSVGSNNPADKGAILWVGLNSSGEYVSINVADPKNSDVSDPDYSETVTLKVDSNVFPNESELIIANTILRTDLVEINSNANIVGSIVNLKQGDKGSVFIGELAVGLPDAGKETVLGEGDSHTLGMTVLRFDGTSTYTDITDDVIDPDGTTAQAFDGTGVGNILYIGGSLTRFTGIKVIIDTGISPSGGYLTAFSNTSYIVLEYWDGSVWTEVKMMSSAGNAPYTPLRDFKFDSGVFQYRFGSKTNWTQNSVNGVSAFWVRFRITTAISVIPTIDQIKLGTSRMEVNKDGFIEYFGTAEVLTRLPFDVNWLSPSSNSPSDQDIYLQDSINVGRVENEFAAGTLDQVGFVTELPSDIDTSSPLFLRFRFLVNSSSSGNIVINIRWGYNVDIQDDPSPSGNSISSVYESSADAPTTAPGFIDTIADVISVPSGSDDRVFTKQYGLDVSRLVSERVSGSLTGDILWVSFERDGSSGSDTYPGNASLIQLTPFYRKWREGEYYNTF